MISEQLIILIKIVLLWQIPQKNIQLAENLVLRAATPADAEQVIDLNTLVHGDPEKNEPQPIQHTHTIYPNYETRRKPSSMAIVKNWIKFNNVLIS